MPERARAVIYLIVIFCLSSAPDHCQAARVEIDGSQLECVTGAEGVIAQLACLDEWQGYRVTGWRCERGLPI